MRSSGYATWLRRAAMLGYFALLMLPIYWMLMMSLRPNRDILGDFTWRPDELGLDNYRTIFTDASWYTGYLNSIQYTLLNMVLSLLVALPAAYAFSRHRFLGDNHLFFWLLTNRMAPAAVFLLPVFQLYQNVGLFDTPLAVALAHMLFNVPLAVWILEGFMSAVPRAIDETALIDGYRFPRFFVQIFLPLIRSGVGVAAFFCFMFSWVELLMARTLTSVKTKPIAATMTRTVSASGLDWGLLAAAGVLTIVPGALIIWFVRKHIAKGFAMGAGLMAGLSVMPGLEWPDLEWMAWTTATAVFVASVFVGLGLLTVLAALRPSTPRKGLLPMATARGDRVYVSLLGTGLILIVLVATTSQPLPVGLGLAAVWTAVVLRWG